jgi:carbon monoxide dehydrogenase subunit G
VRAPFSLGTRVLGGAAALLILALAVGALLPGTWSAERSVEIDATPESVFSRLDAPEGWRRWTPWPDSGLAAEGPSRGPGARLVWSDRELGEGSWEIVESDPPARMTYRVEVHGPGTMRTSGTVLVEPVAAGARVRWREEGDFGWNPLMGYWARFMERAQGGEMEKSLARLKAIVEAEGGR